MALEIKSGRNALSGQETFIGIDAQEPSELIEPSMEDILTELSHASETRQVELLMELNERYYAKALACQSLAEALQMKQELNQSHISRIVGRNTATEIDPAVSAIEQIIQTLKDEIYMKYSRMLNAAKTNAEVQAVMDQADEELAPDIYISVWTRIYKLYNTVYRERFPEDTTEEELASTGNASEYVM